MVCASLLGASMNHTMFVVSAWALSDCLMLTLLHSTHQIYITHTHTTSILRILHTRLHYTHPYHFDLANSTHQIYITHTHTTSILRILHTRLHYTHPYHFDLVNCTHQIYITHTHTTSISQNSCILDANWISQL